MKKQPQHRHLPTKYKRAIVATSIVLMLVLLAYAEIIRPNQDAKAYVTHLDDNSKPLQQCFDKLRDTTELKLYYAPDITLEQKRQDTATILKQIDTCQAELKNFSAASHELIDLHISGYTPSYRQAKIFQRQAYDITGQSNDVLSQYEQLATFLSQYYEHIVAFETYTLELQDNKYYTGTAAQIAAMQQQANDLRQRAAQIRKLDAPAEFRTTKSETADMFTAAAAAIDTIGNGSLYGNDYTIQRGYDAIDVVSSKYDSTVINLPFEQLIKSYIPKQVNQLPSKVENLLVTASSE